MTLPIPFPIAQAAISYGSDPFYGLLSDLLGGVGGVVGQSHLKCVQHAGGANFGVDVSVGVAYAPSTQAQDLRRCPVTTVSNPITTPTDWASVHSAADPTNPRIDRVILKLNDANIDGSGLYSAQFSVVTGTATVGATLANLTGAGAVPANGLLLANVLIPALATTIVTANIQDVRVRASIGGGIGGALTAGLGLGYGVNPGGAAYLSSAGTFPANPQDGDIIDVNMGSNSVAGGGCVQRFRYVAADTSGFPWRFVGGPPLNAANNNAGSGSVTTTTYSALSANAPTITVPRTGYYIISLMAQLVNTTTTNPACIAPSSPTLTAVDANAFRINAGTQQGGFETQPVLLTKGETLTLQARGVTTATATASDMVLSIEPVQVS